MLPRCASRELCAIPPLVDVSGVEGGLVRVEGVAGDDRAEGVLDDEDRAGGLPPPKVVGEAYPDDPVAGGLEFDSRRSDGLEKSATLSSMLCAQSILLAFASRQFRITSVNCLFDLA